MIMRSRLIAAKPSTTIIQDLISFADSQNTPINKAGTTQMLVQEYGLFWQRDEVNWWPGSGKKGNFRLLGRIGKHRPNLMVADFRFQQGVYVLYGNHGAHYVGLAEAERGLGERLKDHLSDDHHDAWDRFSWFGFRPVLMGYEDGLSASSK